MELRVAVRVWLLRGPCLTPISKASVGWRWVQGWSVTGSCGFLKMIKNKCLKN